MAIKQLFGGKIFGASMLLIVAAGCAAQEKSASTTKPYTLSTCIVSDEALGHMGEPVVYNHNGQEIKFCCSSCETDFKKDPDKYLKKMQAAAKSPATKPAGA